MGAWPATINGKPARTASPSADNAHLPQTIQGLTRPGRRVTPPLPPVWAGKPTERGAEGRTGGEGERSKRHCVMRCTGIEGQPDIILSERRLTFAWCFVAREFEEPLREGMQMKVVLRMTYAPTRRKAKRLRTSIAKATQQKESDSEKRVR
jgi:hypothetical protein